MTLLLTVPADQMSGAEFLRLATGVAPLTHAERIARETEDRRLIAELEAQHRREMIALRKRILALFETEEGRAGTLARWEAEGVDVTQLTEVEHLGPGRVAA